MNSIKNKFRALPVALTGLALTAPAAFAAGEPIDLASAGTTVVGYITTAAGAAVVIFVALIGIRFMVRAFKGVK